MRLALLLLLTSALTATGRASAQGPSEEASVPELPRAARQLRTWQEAMALARARSLDLRVAVDETERARAQQEIALAATLPSVSGTGAAVRNQLTENVSTVGVGPALQPYLGGSITTPTPNVAYGSLVASQQLLDLGAWHGVGTARADVRAGLASEADSLRVVARDAADTALGVLTAERIATLNRVGLRAALDRLELTRRKQALGIGTGLDVARVQRDVDAARDTLAVGDDSLHRAREALGLALGVGGELDVSDPRGAEGWARDASGECKRTTALDQRDDLRAAHAREAAAEHRITDAELRFLPTVGAQTTLATTSDPTILPQTTWSLQATLTLPLWDSGLRHGGVRDARAQRDEATQRLSALRRSAGVEIERAERALTVGSERQAIATDARAVAATEDALTRQAYAIGQGTSLELVTAASALRQAEIQLALREFDLLQAKVALAFATASCER